MTQISPAAASALSDISQLTPGGLSDAEMTRLIQITSHLSPEDRDQVRQKLAARAASGNAGAAQAVKVMDFDKAMREDAALHLFGLGRGTSSLAGGMLGLGPF